MYNNAAMANRVREAILLNPRISAQDIIVLVKERVVTLAGDVDTPEMRDAAEDSARAVEGVERVENVLDVRPKRWFPTAPEMLRRREERGG